MLFKMSAVRSDGCICTGTVDAENINEAKLAALRTYRTGFIAKGRIYGCTVPGHNNNDCSLHVGERFTFSKITAIPEDK